MNSHCEHAAKRVETIIARYEGPLLRYATRILGDSSLAQKAVESVFILVLPHKLKKQADLSPEDLEAELYRSVHKAAIESIPERKKRLKQAGVSSAARTDTDGIVMEAVRGLEPGEQQMVVLKVFEKMTNAEISRITQKEEEKVATLLYKSVIKVADQLKKAGLL